MLSEKSNVLFKFSLAAYNLVNKEVLLPRKVKNSFELVIRLLMVLLMIPSPQTIRLLRMQYSQTPLRRLEEILLKFQPNHSD
jgi:hypothetical protein